ncbi:MAG: hypothetical protein Q7S84_02145 [bacterium]|nr:hypothetical protein [bacterium]
MPLRLRKTFFYLCLVAFLAVGGYLVLFTRGLVFDLRHFELVPTGALYLKFTPSDATLLVNGKERPAGANILSPGTFVDNLAPGTYTVTVTRPNFSTWTKALTVSSTMVTAASHIRLWPTHAPATPVAIDIANFWLTGEGAVLQDASGTLRLARRTIRGSTVVESDQGSSRLLTEGQGQFYLMDLSAPDTTTNISALFVSLRSRTISPVGPVATGTLVRSGSTTSTNLLQASSPQAEHVRAVLLHPFSGQKLIVGTDAGLYELDTKKVSLERLASVDRFTALAKSGGDAFIMNGSSTMTVVNLILHTSVTYAFPLSSGLRSLIASPNGSYLAAISDTGVLSVLDRTAGTFTPVAHNVVTATIAPDNTALIFLSTDGRLNLYYLSDVAGDELFTAGQLTASAGPLPVPPAGTLTALPSFSGTVLVQASGTLLAAETDLRGQVNSTALAAHVRSFAIRDTTLYLLSTDGTLSSMNLAP